jgi:hypothetical protein
MTNVSDYANRLLTDPGAGLAPIRTGIRAGVNREFSGLDKVLRNKFLSSGGGRSGKFGRATREGEVARLGKLSDVEGIMAQMLLEQQERGASLSERLLSQNFGSDFSTTSDSTQFGSSTGTNVAPGSALGSGLATGADTAMTLWLMNKLLKGDGGGGPTPEWSPGGG